MVSIEEIKTILSKEISIKRKEKISVEDLRSLNELLRSGLSIKNSLSLLTTRSNEKTFNEILKGLDSGKLVEEMVTDKLPAGISEYLRPLIKTMTFQSALELSLSFYDKVRENEGKIEKTMLYPFVLLFVSLTALYLFDAYGLDQILEMLKSFKTDLASFTVIRILIRIVVYLFYFGMLAGVCILLYFTRNRNITIFYILCCKYLKSGLIQVYFCEEFISLFLICLELGYKTKDSLDILKALHNKPLVSFLAFHLDERLLEGDSLKEASRQPYYDETLSKFINVAVHTNDFERILSDYVQLGRKKIISYMNKLALYIQLSSYVMIGVIIIFIYQILFLPMQALSSF